MNTFELCRASAEERRRRLPGDELVPHPKLTITHAITVNAPPGAVWPWVIQMGSGRAGWYAYDHIDNAGVPSARRIVLELQHLAVGDVMPWLPGAKDGFIVREVIPQRALVYVVPLQLGAERRASHNMRCAKGPACCCSERNLSGNRFPTDASSSAKNG